MKKTIFFAMMAAVLGFTACSKEGIAQNETAGKGMVLRATVDQPTEARATFTDKEGEEGVWQFAFDTDDEISVTNTAIEDTYYTFTNDGTEFTSEDAKSTEAGATWYAYFPSNEISLVGQSGTKADVANKYALAGATATATTGKEGLNITMASQVAILVIDNQAGEIDINVKNSGSTWVSGMAANEAGFTVTTATDKQTLLSATATGTYYVAVPAGVQISVKEGNRVIKSTGTSGLTAGCYYNLTVFPFGQGEAAATGVGMVRWIQLWEDGPKFAEYNVGATSASEYGGYYTWGGTCNNNPALEGFTWTDDHNSGTSNLSGDTDTATKIWGSNWRMPTSNDYRKLDSIGNICGGLVYECTLTWIDDYNGTGVKGLLCTGKGNYESNSVFFPSAGYATQSASPSFGSGLYFTSTICTGDVVYYLNFSYSTRAPKPGLSAKLNNAAIRANACSVRAVLAE